MRVVQLAKGASWQTDCMLRERTDALQAPLIASDEGSRSLPMLTSAQIFTIGYEGRTVGELLDQLQLHKIDVLVDVRLTPLSRKKGFSKRVLAQALAEVGIEYVHEPGLGNPKDNRDDFRKGVESAWARYREHLAAAQLRLDSVIALTVDRTVALLCFERDHAQCHRSCITQVAQASDPRLVVSRL